MHPLCMLTQSSVPGKYLIFCDNLGALAIYYTFHRSMLCSTSHDILPTSNILNAPSFQVLYSDVVYAEISWFYWLLLNRMTFWGKSKYRKLQMQGNLSKTNIDSPRVNHAWLIQWPSTAGHTPESFFFKPHSKHSTLAWVKSRHTCTWY